ncbi:hypothetical protein V6N13_064059 [Hibiscus sabdariffa]
MNVEGQDNRMTIDDISNNIMYAEGHDNRFDILNDVNQSNRLEVVATQTDACELIAWIGLRSEVPRAGKAHIIDYLGELRKGKGRKKISIRIANGSLSDSDFQSQKRVILKEAGETLALGKYLGVKTIGYETEIVNDIAVLLEG